MELGETNSFSAKFLFFIFKSMASTEASATTASPLQVFSNQQLDAASLHILTTCCESKVMDGCGGRDGRMVHIAYVGLNLTQ